MRCLKRSVNKVDDKDATNSSTEQEIWVNKQDWSLKWLFHLFVVKQPSATSLKQSVKDRLGPLLPANSEPPRDSCVASQVCVDSLVEDGLFLAFTCQNQHMVCMKQVFFFLSAFQNASKVSVKDRLGVFAKPATLVEKVKPYFIKSNFKKNPLKLLKFYVPCLFLLSRCFQHPWASPRLFTILLL